MRGPNLTNDERHQMACILLENAMDYKPRRGLMKELGAKFQVDRKTVFRVWQEAKQQRLNGEPICVKSKMFGNSGRVCLPIPNEQIMGLHKSKRGTMKNLAQAIGVSKTTIHNWVRQGKIKSHTSAIKPDLTDENKHIRLNFVISKLYYDRLLNALKFKEMSHMVHIDEKWFFMTQCNARYYLCEDEPLPYRSCKSKRFITKVMFMAAVSRPMYAENGECIFDGKVGCFPFTYQEPTQRASKNRPAGTIETKSVVSITKEVTRAMLIEKIIPAIKSKWPSTASKTIEIQQDNAKPHLRGDDPLFLQHGTSDGWNISLRNQPANSPDLDVLDLGFFRSIQSLQTTKHASTVDELVKNVEEAWNEEEAQRLDDVWLSLQACMLEIMKRKGHNDYKLPHLQKNAQRRQGILPRNLDACQEEVKSCIQYLLSVGKGQNLDELIRELEVVVPNWSLFSKI